MSSEILPFRQRPTPREMVERVREFAKVSFNIRWAQHARDRMDERGITTREVLDTIRGGEIFGKMVPDGDDEWKVTLKRRRAGRVVQVVCVVSNGGDLTVVTVM